jgi:methylglutaconyl-CoA hydratase
MTPLVLRESGGPRTVVLTLNRPDRRNALSIGMLEGLCAAVAEAEGDSSIRALILRGSGPAFCAGLDLDEAADPARSHRSAEMMAAALRTLAGTRLVTIAAVHGAAVAGGAGLMSACDFAVAAEGTKIGYPEPRRGLVAALVMCFLRRQLRERDARELLLLAELVDAARARSIGLVNRVVPEDRLAAEASDIASKALLGGPEAIAETKRLLAALWPSSLDGDFEQASKTHLAIRDGAEAAEGVAAFRQKRPPNWA